MAFITVNFHPASIDMDQTFTAVIPDGATPLRTVYLLHGLSDNETSWSRYSAVEDYARARNIAVIMPCGGRSFYTDMAKGFKYNTYITKELLEYTRRLFPLSVKREDTFLMGQSMGGYGAFKLALQNPDIYGAAVSFSGVLDAAPHFAADYWSEEGALIFPDRMNITGTENDLFTLLDGFKTNGKPKPRLLSVCGTEDFLYEDNIKFRDYIDGLGFDFTYKEAAGGHTWPFWNKHTPEALDFLLATK